MSILIGCVIGGTIVFTVVGVIVDLSSSVCN